MCIFMLLLRVLSGPRLVFVNEKLAISEHHGHLLLSLCLIVHLNLNEPKLKILIPLMLLILIRLKIILMVNERDYLLGR